MIGDQKKKGARPGKVLTAKKLLENLQELLNHRWARSSSKLPENFQMMGPLIGQSRISRKAFNLLTEALCLFTLVAIAGDEAIELILRQANQSFWRPNARRLAVCPYSRLI